VVEQSLLTGPCKVGPQENPHLSCRLVDVGDPSGALPDVAALSSLLACEVWEAASGQNVAYRLGGRWVQRYAPWPLPALGLPPVLRSGGTYLITGGLGRIGLLLAEYLCQEVRANVVLVGRSAFPPRSSWLQADVSAAPSASESVAEARLRSTIARLQALEEGGSRVLTLQADVSDRSSLQSAVSAATSQLGAIHGVFHCAGDVGPQMLRTASEVVSSDWVSAFGAKLGGACVLESLWPDGALDFCVMLSSLSSVLGGLGYTVYAASNSALDAFAWSRRDRRTRWLSVNLDGWSFSPSASPSGSASTAGSSVEGSSEEASSLDSSSPLDHSLILGSDTSELFRRLLWSLAQPQIAISVTPLSSRLSRWVDRRVMVSASGSRSSSLEASRYARPSLATPYEAASTTTEQMVIEVMQSILGIDRLGVNDSFFDLGGDSLMATRLIAQLRDLFEINIPLQTAFQSPTPAGLASSIDTILWNLQDTSPISPVGEIGEI